MGKCAFVEVGISEQWDKIPWDVVFIPYFITDVIFSYSITIAGAKIYFIVSLIYLDLK